MQGNNKGEEGATWACLLSHSFGWSSSPPNSMQAIGSSAEPVLEIRMAGRGKQVRFLSWDLSGLGNVWHVSIRKRKRILRNEPLEDEWQTWATSTSSFGTARTCEFPTLKWIQWKVAGLRDFCQWYTPEGGPAGWGPCSKNKPSLRRGKEDEQEAHFQCQRNVQCRFHTYTWDCWHSVPVPWWIVTTSSPRSLGRYNQVETGKQQSSNQGK